MTGLHADVRRWPNDPSIAHLVLLDVTTVPTTDEIRRVTERTFASDASLRAIRTSALFPGPRERFGEAGYVVSDRLVLLERPIDRIEPIRTLVRRPPDTGVRLRRMRRRDLHHAVRIDGAAFPAGWSNTTATLTDIATATPRHRSRLATIDDTPAGFVITGAAGPVGYLQRLAVDPAFQRRGVGIELVHDALAWLQRRGATTALVNTGVDNVPALGLYRATGFHHRRDELVVMERER